MSYKEHASYYIHNITLEGINIICTYICILYNNVRMRFTIEVNVKSSLFEQQHGNNTLVNRSYLYEV